MRPPKDAADVLGHSYSYLSISSSIEPARRRFSPVWQHFFFNLISPNKVCTQAALHCHCPHGSVGTRSTLLMCGLHNATPLPVGLFCLSVPGKSDFCSALCRRNSLTLAEVISFVHHSNTNLLSPCHTLHAQPEDLLLLICCECGESVWCEHEEESLGGEAPMCE
ncbi:proto-oncogene serine/threonine-protein kinase Pim-1 [Sarotherodon galilaeus]